MIEDKNVAELLMIVEDGGSEGSVQTGERYGLFISHKVDIGSHNSITQGKGHGPTMFNAGHCTCIVVRGDTHSVSVSKRVLFRSG